MQVISLVIYPIIMVLAVNCNAKSAYNGRIVGGYAISIEQAPYQVALLYYGALRCGGSILSSKYILTAAHCTSTITQISHLTIRAGSSDYFTNGTIHEVGRIDIHPRFDRIIFDYDASILTVKTDIKFDSTKKSIQLPYLNQPLPKGSFVGASGWGSTQNAIDNMFILRMVELRVVSQIECHKSFINDGGVTSRMVCASADGKDACDGGEIDCLNKLNKLEIEVRNKE